MDESCIYHLTPESRRWSAGARHLKCPKRNNQLASLWREFVGVIYTDYFEKGKSVKSDIKFEVKVSHNANQCYKLKTATSK